MSNIAFIGLNLFPGHIDGITKNTFNQINCLKDENTIFIITNRNKCFKDLKYIKKINFIFIPVFSHKLTKSSKLNYFIFYSLAIFLLPILVLKHKLEIIHYHLWLSLICYPLFIVPHLFKCKTLWTFYSEDAFNYCNKPGYILNYLDGVICLDEHSYRFIKRYTITNTILIPPIVNLIRRTNSLTYYKKQFKLLKKTIVISYIGHIYPERGVHLLMDAFSKIKKCPSFKKKNLILLIAGTGMDNLRYLTMLKQKYKSEIDNKSILFLGPQKEVSKLYFSSDILVLPLISFKHVITVPLTLLEAAICRVPIIATRDSRIKDLLIDNETGFLFLKNDANSLSNVLKKVIYLVNTDKLTRIKNNNQKFVMNKFSYKLNKPLLNSFFVPSNNKIS